MPTTPLLLIPYPAPNQNPWNAGFDAMINAIDTSLYTPREDRNIIISGGGVLTFVASSGVLTWAAPINLLAAVTGYQWSIPAGQVTLNDGQLFYITVARAPQNNTTYVPVVGSFTPNQPNGDNQILVGIRIGSVVHFRDGFLIGDGQAMVIFDNTTVGGGGGGITQITGDAAAGPGSGSQTIEVTGLRGISVPVPSGTNTVLTYDAGAYSWSIPTDGITTLMGDVAAGPGAGSQEATVIGIQGVSIPSPTGTDTVLTYNAGAFTWTLGNGISQLTGDGEAGPGSGSQALTIVKINGASVPIGGALTIGNILHVTGASTLGYGALNLAGGSAYISGHLPVSNFAGGTDAQLLLTTGTSATWASMSQDAEITNSGAVTVVGIQSIAVPTPTGEDSILTYNAGAFSWGTGSGGIPTTPVLVSSSGSFEVPLLNTTYLINSEGGPVTFTATGAPVDGLVLTFVDYSDSWNSGFFFVAQAGATAQYPQFPSSTSSSVYCYVEGASFSFTWSELDNQWYCTAASFGYSYPYSPSYGTESDDTSTMSYLGPNYYQGSVNSFPPLFNTLTLTDNDLNLTGPWTYVTNEVQQFWTEVTNRTSYPVTIVDSTGYGSVTIPGSLGSYFGQALVFSDGYNGVAGTTGGGGGGGWSVVTQDISAGGSIGVSVGAGTSQLILTGSPASPATVGITTGDPGDSYEFLVTNQTTSPIALIDSTAPGIVDVAPLSSAVVVCDGYTLLQEALDTPAQRISYPGLEITTYTPTNPTFNKYWIDTTGIGGAQFVLPPVSGICDHYRITIKNNTNSMGVYPLLVVATDGASPQIESPVPLGTYNPGSTGFSMSAPGGEITWEYGATENTWFIV